MLEVAVTSEKRIMESQYRELGAHAMELEIAKKENVLLRKVIAEKDEKIMQHKYLFMELEKELWRIQREAAQTASTR